MGVQFFLNSYIDSMYRDYVVKYRRGVSRKRSERSIGTNDVSASKKFWDFRILTNLFFSEESG